MRHPARLLALPAFLSASTALADPGLPRSTTLLNAGLLLSQSARPDGAMTAYGLEVSLHDFHDKDYTTGLGLFAQFQGTSWEHLRFAGGVQGTYQFVGVELGAAYETGNRDFAGTASLHVAPFVSALGFVTLALRIGIPLSGPDGHRPGYGTDIGGVLSLKFPWPLGGY